MDLAGGESQWGLGRRLSWGGVAFASARGSRRSHTQEDGRFVPAGGRERKFDARCQRPTLGDIFALDILGVLCKLLLVVWRPCFLFFGLFFFFWRPCFKCHL